MEHIEEGQIYTFEQLEDFLNEWENRDCCLKVLDVKHISKAFMHTFGGNFCGDWLSGDGVLFYDDNEQHSAAKLDEFRLLAVIRL